MKQEVGNAVYEMEDGAEVIEEVLKVLESCNLEKEVLDSLRDDLGTVVIRLQAQAKKMGPILNILRERPKFMDWEIPSTPSSSSEYDCDE